MEERIQKLEKEVINLKLDLKKIEENIDSFIGEVKLMLFDFANDLKEIARSIIV